MIYRVLLNPWFLLGTLALSALTGTFARDFALGIGKYGHLYINLLQMTVIPVLITAVVSSMGRLIEVHGFTRWLMKLTLVSLLFLALASLIGILGGMITRPGAGLTEEARAMIGKVLSEAETRGDASVARSVSFFEMIRDMIPINPVAAISQGKHLAILFFSLVLGIALGFGEPAARDVTLRVAEALYAAQLKIIHWTLCALPFGIFCIFSEQIANMGLGIFRAMGGFVLFSIALAFVTSLLYVGVIARVSRLPFLQALAALKRVISVSFVTASSFASIPVMIEALVKGFRRDVRDVNLIVPLAVNLNRQGSSIYMAFAFMFVAQLYSLPIPIDSLLLVWGLCALSGMIPAGIVGLIPIVFTPVGLPIEVGITLLLAVEVLLDPVFTVVNALGFCSTSLLFSRSSPKSLGAEEASP